MGPTSEYLLSITDDYTNKLTQRILQQQHLRGGESSNYVHGSFLGRAFQQPTCLWQPYQFFCAAWERNRRNHCEQQR
jgi:hypothetical protein